MFIGKNFGKFLCMLAVGPVTWHTPGVLQVYTLKVCLHTKVWERGRRKNRECRYTPTLFFWPPSSFPALIKLVWWLSLTRCRLLWQPSASGRSWSCPLTFGPLTVSSSYRAPCDVRKTFKFFLGLCHWCLMHCTPRIPSLCASRTKPSNRFYA